MNNCYEVPKYQREYTWRQSQWSQLYDDIFENDAGYYLGSIICISNYLDSQQINRLQLIDGQQRLTTISIFYAALYKLISENLNFEDPSQRNLRDMVNLTLYCEQADNKVILTPQTQSQNLADYLYLMCHVEIISGIKKPAYYGNRLISKCYQFFYNELKKGMECSKDRFDYLKKMKDKVSSTVVVKIEVNSQSDAYILFESLNNRGMTLSPVDLLKNTALANAEKKGLSVDDCFVIWQRILENISQDYSAQERFFRSYYNAFRQELNEPFKEGGSGKTNPLGDIATRSNLLSIYSRIIEKNLSTFFSDMLEVSEIYNQLIEPEHSESKYSRSLCDLNHIQGAPSYILLLYLIRNKDKLGLNDSVLSNTVDFLVSFFVRRNITDVPPTRDLNRRFIELVSKVKELSISAGDSCVQDVMTTIRSFLISISADDDQFRDKLLGNIYEDNYGVTRFLLCYLSEKKMTRENSKDLWERKEKGSKIDYVWTVEHIFPEGENIPKHWVDMIADGDSMKASEYRSDYCHKLGNLTISAYNQNLGNLSFVEKRDRKDQNGNYIGYKNGLDLNSDLRDKEQWTIEDIKIRTEKLVNQVFEYFKYENNQH